MLIHDHVYTDNICNLKCAYCPCDVDLIKRKGNTLSTIASDSSTAHQESVEEFLMRNTEVLNRSREQIYTPILKLSGGEIFMIPEFMDNLPNLAQKYDIVQILTNGTMITPRIVDKLATIPNLHIQVSVDGHTGEMNVHRFGSSITLSAIIGNLELLSKSHIPLEINCVLTAANTSNFFDFVAYVSHRLGECIIYPFPVRSNPEIFPRTDQVQIFEEALNRKFDIFSHLLPPKEYFNALIEFLKSGRRRKGCHVPHVILATSGDGQLEACTCGPVKQLGSVLDLDLSGDEAFKRVGKDSCYVDVTDPVLSPECCRDCFTHYDVINLFLEGLIKSSELKRMPFFDTPAAMDQLHSIKQSIDLRDSEVD